MNLYFLNFLNIKAIRCCLSFYITLIFGISVVGFSVLNKNYSDQIFYSISLMIYIYILQKNKAYFYFLKAREIINQANSLQQLIDNLKALEEHKNFDIITKAIAFGLGFYSTAFIIKFIISS